MIDQLLNSLVETSKRLSRLGQTELSQHQECTLQVLGFAKIDQVECQIFDSAQLKSLDFSAVATSNQIRDKFSNSDVQVISQSDGEKAVLLFSVENAEMFDGVPVFWQNYLSAEFLPAVFVICIEKVEIRDSVFEYLALPYFTILNLSATMPVPNIGFVGQDIRDRAVQAKDRSEEEAMSNIGCFLGLVVAFLQKQGAEQERH